MPKGDLYLYLLNSTIRSAERGNCEDGRKLFLYLADEIRSGELITPQLSQYFLPMFDEVATSKGKLNVERLFNLKPRKGRQRKDVNVDYEIFLAVIDALLTMADWDAYEYVSDTFPFQKYNRQKLSPDTVRDIYFEMLKADREMHPNSFHS